MKIIIAPDSFKGCMRSPDVCEAFKKGLAREIPDAEIISIPMADGGEGTVEAAVAATGGSLKKVTVSGPLGKKVKARFGILGKSKTAIMEMASASGIELLKREELNPLKASTYGTGELINAIIRDGFREIIIGIGGSATVDGGAGMAQALGYNLLDKKGDEIQHGGAGLLNLKKILSCNANPLLSKVKIRVACDVKNPLLGRNGAAKIFGPQKGASPHMVEQLEKALSNYSKILKSSAFLKSTDNPGDGAAGGLGTGLRAFCNSTFVSGAELMIELSEMKKHLKTADFIITGEGCTDSQTSSGKLCSVIAQTARKAKVPVILISGALKGNTEKFNDVFDAVFSISAGPCSLDEAILSAKKNIVLTARNIARLIRN